MDAEKLQRLVTTEMPYGKHKGTLLATRLLDFHMLQQEVEGKKP